MVDTETIITSAVVVTVDEVGVEDEVVVGMGVENHYQQNHHTQHLSEIYRMALYREIWN